MTDKDTPEFQLVRLFEAPLARVWTAWTVPDEFGQWFGPAGSKTEVLAFDLTPGGTAFYRMTTQQGFVMYGKFVYRQVEPEDRLVWVHSFADGNGGTARAPFFNGVWPLEILSTVAFEAVGEKTRITLTWVPMNASPEELQSFRSEIPGMTLGWGSTFTQLDAYLR